MHKDRRFILVTKPCCIFKILRAINLKITLHIIVAEIIQKSAEKKERFWAVILRQTDDKCVYVLHKGSNHIQNVNINQNCFSSKRQLLTKIRIVKKKSLYYTLMLGLNWKHVSFQFLFDNFYVPLAG